MLSGLLAAAMLFCFLFICLFVVVFLGGGAEVTQIGREGGVLLVYLTKRNQRHRHMGPVQRL